MRPFEELTLLGRMRRFRKMAETALGAYGLERGSLTFLTYHGNVIYRVDLPDTARSAGRDRLHAPNRYILRVHMDYHGAAAIRSELQWLLALRRDADMPVPEPVPTPDGELVIDVDIPGSSKRRKCSLLRWVNGRFLAKRLRPRHARAWGRLMARLHQHAVGWKRPTGFTRRHNDYDGMFGDGARFEFPAGELWDAIPVRFRESFETVARQAKQVMADLGKGPAAYGLVHSDLDVKTNILFSGGQARVIDFDDSGFAYWVHDLAFALSPWQGGEEEHWVRDALLEGYSEIRSFPARQLEHLDLFMAAFNATLMLWMIDWAKLCPESDGPPRHIARYGENLMRYFNRR